jgi:CBS domain-containing protein
MIIASILKQKGAEVASVRPTDRIAEVVESLSARRIGAVIVLDATGRLLGIVSERDIVRALHSHGARALEMTAGQLMTADLSTATPQTTVSEAMSLMTQGRFRHLPVMQEGKLVGLVSIGDVVKSRLMEQEQEVDGLKAYVAGG